MSIPTAQEFVNMLKNQKEEKTVRFATISNVYTSGRPQLIFDGESRSSIKGYPYLSSYTPAKGDRVVVIHGVILGKII